MFGISFDFSSLLQQNDSYAQTATLRFLTAGSHFHVYWVHPVPWHLGVCHEKEEDSRFSKTLCEVFSCAHPGLSVFQLEVQLSFLVPGPTSIGHQFLRSSCHQCGVSDLKACKDSRKICFLDAIFNESALEMIQFTRGSIAFMRQHERKTLSKTASK